jgi:hypothetical protein
MTARASTRGFWQESHSVGEQKVSRDYWGTPTLGISKLCIRREIHILVMAIALNLG